MATVTLDWEPALENPVFDDLASLNLVEGQTMLLVEAKERSGLSSGFCIYGGRWRMGANGYGSIRVMFDPLRSTAGNSIPLSYIKRLRVITPARAVGSLNYFQGLIRNLEGIASRAHRDNDF